MFELIIAIIIIYYVLQKHNSNSINNVEKILKEKGFANISTINSTHYSLWKKAFYNGDSYIIEIIKIGNSVSIPSLNLLTQYAKKNNINNIILIPNNATISQTAQKFMYDKKINVWDNSKLNNTSNSTSPIINTMPLDDNCEIPKESFDPIQDGAKANSLFSSFFGKKIEHL